MQEGFPIPARLFREHVRGYGLSLADPAIALGTVTLCSRALHAAGFTPDDPIAEFVQFSRADLDHAWEAHTRGRHHDAVNSLTAEQARAFRHDYTNALAHLLRTDEHQP